MMGIESSAAANFGMSRRQALRAGFLGLGGLTMGELFRLQAQGAAETRDTAVILLFAHGGPSHLETYDLKPDAPDEIRGPFSPIRTNVPGIDICEHLPKHSRVAHRYTLIRSCCHDVPDHFGGHVRFLSGSARAKPEAGHESYYPQVGAVVNRLLPGRRGMPSALSINGVLVNGPDYAAGISEGFWGKVYRVPIVQHDMPNASLRVSPSQFQDRQQLLRSFDQMRRDLDPPGGMRLMDEYNRRAVEVLTSGAVRRAFDLSQESARVRERYGEGYGQEVLVARRLVEAGVNFVTVCDRGTGPGSLAHNWDDHAVNWDLLTAMRARLPRYDHLVSTLIDDLFDRGLDRKVLLIVTGEFGRTPRLEHKDGRIGRDHYPAAMSMLFSGGGMPMGQVIGATNRRGEHPIDRRLDPNDVLATIYHHLGIDHRQDIVDTTGRPTRLTSGEPIAELV